MKIRFILTITAIFLAIMFVVNGCGGGGDNSIPPASNTPTDDDNGEYINITEELGGTITMNSETGVAIYESEEKEIQPGLLFKRSTVLTAKDPNNDELGYSGITILKLTNTTDRKLTTKFIENIPKSFAQHVDQLEYKILISKSSSLTITELLNDSSSFVSIDDLVDQGYAEVLREDPSVGFVLTLGVIGTAFIQIAKPDIFGRTPLSVPTDLDPMTNEQKKKWMEDRLLTKYCSAVRKSADKNNIPARLLANIILNEVSDYDMIDALQEIIYTGENKSHGWPQLQPKRIIDHGLIDIGTVDEVRDPTVDIVEDDLIYERLDPDGEPFVIKTPVNNKIYERLITPEPSIELAAREIAYLLDMFKKGSSILNNPWAKALLKNPAEGIDRNNIYANLKVLPTPSADPDEQQIALDRTLAVLVTAGYNGSGAIFNRTKANQVFSPLELQIIDTEGYDGLIEHKIPWETGTDMVNNDYPFKAPRLHAENAGIDFPKGLYESECLKDKDTVNITVNIPGYNASFQTEVAYFGLGYINDGPAIYPSILAYANVSPGNYNNDMFGMWFSDTLQGPSTYPITGAYYYKDGYANVYFATQDILDKGTEQNQRVMFWAVSGTVKLEDYTKAYGERLKGTFSVNVEGNRVICDDTSCNTFHYENIKGTIDGTFDGILKDPQVYK